MANEQKTNHDGILLVHIRTYNTDMKSSSKTTSKDANEFVWPNGQSDGCNSATAHICLNQ
jgi:hypothetical protein